MTVPPSADWPARSTSRSASRSGSQVGRPAGRPRPGLHRPGAAALRGLLVRPVADPRLQGHAVDRAVVQGRRADRVRDRRLPADPYFARNQTHCTYTVAVRMDVEDMLGEPNNPTLDIAANFTLTRQRDSAHAAARDRNGPLDEQRRDRQPHARRLDRARQLVLAGHGHEPHLARCWPVPARGPEPVSRERSVTYRCTASSSRPTTTPASST